MLDVSLRMVTAYERGEKQPGPQTLQRMSRTLKFHPAFFSGDDLDEPPTDGTSFRALSNMTARQRDQALGSATLALALSDWIDERFALPLPDVPQYQGVDPATAAIAVRSEWSLGERPIKNMSDTLEARGVRVFSLAEECRAVDAFSFWRGDRPYVFLNTMKSGEHGRMDGAHELAHLVLHWKGTAHGRTAEHEAAQFASEFLMPKGSVLAEAPRGGHYQQLIVAKRKWRVSLAALTYRMHALGLLSDWQYRSLFVEMGKKGARTNEPNGIVAETSQVLTKVFQALRDEGISHSDVASELQIPLDDLARLIFGLVLTPLGETTDEITRSKEHEPSARPQLRLV